MGFRHHQFGQCLVIGHRGAAGLAPENTLPGFALAVRHGVDAIELDVHWAADAMWVIHDPTLQRTTNAKGALADKSFAALRELDAGGGARIPLLEEVLAATPAAVAVNIELKGAGTATPLANLLHGFDDRDLLVSSFDHDELRRFHALSPQVPVAPLFSRWRRDAWDVAAELDAWSINLNVRLVSAARVAAAHDVGLRLLTYTVNEAELAKRLQDYGVDGIFTDYPDGRLGIVSG